MRLTYNPDFFKADKPLNMLRPRRMLGWTVPGPQKRDILRIRFEFFDSNIKFSKKGSFELNVFTAGKPFYNHWDHIMI